MSETGPFHMVRLAVDARRLAQLGRLRKLPTRHDDAGYLVHMLLGEVFGDLAPRPFWVDPSPTRFIQVLGYSNASAEAMKAMADGLADPLWHDGVDWERFASKPMPALFSPGTFLGFELTTTPVQRMSSDGPFHRKGAEMDAFVAECHRRPEQQVDRAEVYRSWLAARMGSAGVRVLQSSVEEFRLAKLLRRKAGNERKARLIDRPVVTFSGRFEVVDSERFQAVMRGGVGRHKAFGFGMLRLRRR